LKDRVETDGRTDRQADGQMDEWTEGIALPPVLTQSVTTYNKFNRPAVEW